MGRERIDFKRNLKFVEKLSSFFHHWKVAGATHDDAYKWLHRNIVKL